MADALDELQRRDLVRPTGGAAPLPLPASAAAPGGLRVRPRGVARRRARTRRRGAGRSAESRRPGARTTSSQRRGRATRPPSRCSGTPGEAVVRRAPAEAARWFSRRGRRCCPTARATERSDLWTALAGALGAAGITSPTPGRPRCARLDLVPAGRDAGARAAHPDCAGLEHDPRPPRRRAPPARHSAGVAAEARQPGGGGADELPRGGPPLSHGVRGGPRVVAAGMHRRGATWAARRGRHGHGAHRRSQRSDRGRDGRRRGGSGARRRADRRGDRPPHRIP